jgi:hypothetical protein
MRSTTEEALQDWLQQAEAVMREYLTWTEQHPTATLREREERTLAMRQSLLGRALQENLALTGTGNEADPPRCPCGTQRRDRGVRKRQLDTTVGTVTIKRTYYICPTCGGGIFPPRPAVRSGHGASE